MAAVFAATLLTGTVLAGTVPAASAVEDYPTWSDVEKAKGNEQATREQIEKIERLIAGLEDAANTLAKDALEKNELYNVARDELATSKSKADSLQKQADAAREKADTSRERAGLLVAQLARTGGGSITMGLVFGEGDPDDFLYALSLRDSLTAKTALIYETASADANAAESLTAQAEVARTERESLAAEAKRTLAAAKTASSSAENRVEAQDDASRTLYRQLAELKGTTSRTEREYQEGLAWEKAQEAVTTPPPPPPVVNPPVKPPATNAVDGAIAFAKAQLGEDYELGGAGPDTWDCSGLTQQSYSSVGVYIGTHSSTNQYATLKAAGRLLAIADIAAGDLLFYSDGGSTTGTKYHVAMYLGGGQMIEAPYPGAVVRIKPIRYGDLVPYAGRPTP
jgi:cell wall-associated NlpC family hydrolase